MDSMYYSTMTDDLLQSTTAATATATAVAGTMILVTWLIGIAIYVLTIIAQWKIFTKAGEAGWKSLIPIYNAVVLFKIIGLSPWLLFVYLAAAIPTIGYIAATVLTIYAMYKLGKAFGQSTGFIVGLVLLNPIFQLILGLGSAEYVGPDAK